MLLEYRLKAHTRWRSFIYNHPLFQWVHIITFWLRLQNILKHCIFTSANIELQYCYNHSVQSLVDISRIFGITCRVHNYQETARRYLSLIRHPENMQRCIEASHELICDLSRRGYISLTSALSHLQTAHVRRRMRWSRCPEGLPTTGATIHGNDHQRDEQRQGQRLEVHTSGEQCEDRQRQRCENGCRSLSA